jgi:hypothetical protein
MDQPSGGTVRGKYMDVYRRQRDGTWKVIATIYNTDEPDEVDSKRGS